MPELEIEIDGGPPPRPGGGQNWVDLILRFTGQRDICLCTMLRGHLLEPLCSHELLGVDSPLRDGVIRRLRFDT